MAMVILMTGHWILITDAQARSLGSHGVIYPIKEEDPIVLIQTKLRALEKSGELARHNKELQKKTKEAVERPKPVEGIVRTTKSRVFYYDPTYVVPEDIKDHTGTVFAKKGTRINPLETVSLSSSLLFFDGDDAEQKAWTKEQIHKACGDGLEKHGPEDPGSSIPCPHGKPPRLILVKGAPLVLAEELKQVVYFDQAGSLTTKFGITHVPAIVSQEKLRLRIEEINLKTPKKEEGK